MPIRNGDEQKLADKLEEENEQRRAKLQQANPKESRVMKQVRDVDLEEDN